MGAPLYGNTFLAARANTLSAYLGGAGMTLRLFQNSFAPTPASPVAAFTESTFPGYNPVSLLGVWGTAQFVQDGQYQILSPIFTFNCTGGPGQNIWGWYITQIGLLIACQVFTSPTMIVSGGAFDFSLRPQEISQSIL
jgi:hypothetical protein